MLKFKFLSYFEFMQTICTNFFHKQIFHSSSENFTIPKLLLEFIFSFSVTGYWFNNICLHQIGKKFWSTWTFQFKKLHNCASFIVILPSIFWMAVSIKYFNGLSPSTAWSPIAVLQASPLTTPPINLNGSNVSYPFSYLLKLTPTLFISVNTYYL